MGHFGKPSYGDRGGNNRIFAGNKRSAGGNRGGGNRFGGGFRGDRGGSSERTMFSTTCDNCKNPCEVPFKPNGTKAVLCNDCFKSDSNNDRSHGDNNRSFGSRDRDSRDGGNRGGDFKKREERTHNTNTWKPTGENTGELKAKIERLEQKIDALIAFLAPSTTAAAKKDKSLKSLIADATDVPEEKLAKAVKETKAPKAKKEVAKKEVKSAKAKPAKAAKETKAPKAKKK